MNEQIRKGLKKTCEYAEKWINYARMSYALNIRRLLRFLIFHLFEERFTSIKKGLLLITMGVVEF